MNYNNMSDEQLVEILRQKDEIINKLMEENEKLSYLSATDAMTGVLNRKAGLELLEREFKLAYSYDKNMVVCFIDVDGLKIVNDTFGHDEGDKLLKSAVQILKKGIRNTDFIIRMGGDEFLVVFPRLGMGEANKVWNRILKLIDEVNINNADYRLSLSHGFYESGNGIGETVTINELIKKADNEMYKIKKEKKRIYSILCGKINGDINS